ncbi:MAG: VWA domain-containing protein [Proteobacteria bacterium]|nr:VWA domain-containing protein [Pseudomonadota bacterium]MBQ9242688.1 VWA domain-containing protein [Pseudomonadota bacterium]
MFEFREPWFLALAILAIPLFIVLKRPIGRIRFSSLKIWPDKSRSFKARTTFIPPLLLSLAFIAFCVTLAGPRIPGGVVHKHKEGISIMLVVDKSGSMEALDMSKDDKEQNRLEALKEVLADFINGNGGTLRGRPDDAIGLVSFALYPDSDCPLTLDHVTLMELIRDIKIADRDESQTAIGDALGLAAERLRDAPGKSKVMILLTDGVNNAGYEDPLETARMAAQFGIKIYTIGIGTNGTAPIYLTNPFTGRKYIDQIPVELDEESLTQIAEMTGGEYFRAKDRTGLEEIYEKIDQLEKTKINEDRTLHYDEKYAQFLIIGLILALLGVLLKVTYYRRSPM